MRAVLLDVTSLWPGWVVTIGPLFIRRRIPRPYRRGARSEPAAAAPLILLVWVFIGLGLHLAGWGALPSSAGNLAGPSVDDGITSAALDVEMDGAVELEGGAGQLYEVDPMRVGGRTAPARSSEAWVDGDVTIRLREGPDPGWFGSGGWRASLSTSPRWTVIVRAANLKADLTEVNLTSLRVAADGSVRLGDPSGEVPVDVDGELVLEVPWDAAVELTGPGRVGPGWEITADGRRYAGKGDSRYLIRAGPESDLTVEQWRGGQEGGEG